MNAKFRLLFTVILASNGCTTVNRSAPRVDHSVSQISNVPVSVGAEKGKASFENDAIAELRTDEAANQASFIEHDSRDAVASTRFPSTNTYDPAPVVVSAVSETEPSTIAETSELLSVQRASYTLEDLEAIALENSPGLTVARATTLKAAGLRSQVGTRPNPTLGYFGQQIADRGTDQHGVFVEQEFVRGNKLQLNREAIGHTQRAQSEEANAQLHRVLTDIRVRFYEAVAAQQQYDATRSFLEIAQRGVEVAQDRQKAQEGTLIETIQAQTLLSEVALAAEQAEVAYQGAWQDLAAIAGLDQAVPVRLDGELRRSTTVRDWQVTLAEIIAQSPELAVAHALVCEKQALLRRQQAQPIANVTGQVGAGYDDGTDNGMINVLLSAPIPVWNQNAGNISAAYHDYVRATQEVQRIEQSIQSRLAREVQNFETALKAVRKYEDEIIPQVNQSLDLSEQAYRAGELDFLQVLVVRRSFYESSIRLIEAQGRLAQADAVIDGLLLTGGLDSPRDFTDGDGIRGASFGGQ